MAEKTGGIIVEDGESVASQRSASLSGPNGKSAGTKQLPSTVREPSLDEAETDDFNTAHEEEGHEARNTPAPPNVTSKRRILFAIIGVVFLIGAVVGVRYWLLSRHYESTDDAFIEGHATQVSPKVSCYVKKIYITDNQWVKAGDLLVEIDPRDYEAKLAQARAALSAATARSKAAQSRLALIRVTAGAGVESARSGVVQARAASSAAEGHANQLLAAVGTAEANVAQAKAQVVAAEAEAVRARADAVRYQTLFKEDVVSRQEFDRVIAAGATAAAQLEAARKRVAAADAQVGEARAAQRAAADQYKQSLSQITWTQAQVGQAAGRLSEANSAPQQF